jgi:threonine synthase
VRYDLTTLKKAFPKEKLADRPWTLWRYSEMLPIADPSRIVSLGETVSPVLECGRLAAEFGIQHLFIKDESHLPTGSFKARGMALAISKANEFGVKKVAVPTAGNAGGALAAYSARDDSRRSAGKRRPGPGDPRSGKRQHGAQDVVS